MPSCLAKVLDEQAGWDERCNWGRGFGFADDNCALLTPQMYEFFGYPILNAIDHVCNPTFRTILKNIFLLVSQMN